ncbi:hypothetical protein BJY01DRAFT_208830 [Aspergillus pseudoustus]|uniref:Uncharacterized protein n=1 Tax=Aspergillus pseudoustus TaxID=1810923 RepID=A0ABR4KK05_9EURO
MMSAKVPGFAMQVRVGVPEFVQIGNPNVIPVTVSFEPVLETVSEILLGVPQTATMTALSIRLRPKTTTRADKTVVAHYDSRTVTKTGMGMAILPFTAIRDLKAISGQEIAVTVTPGGPVEPPLDLGAILDFRLREPDLHPTFCTYNIARRWEWDWELDFSIAGEAVRVGSVYEVVVLPRACEGVGPGLGPAPGLGSVGHHGGDGMGERLPEYERDEELPAYSA